MAQASAPHDWLSIMGGSIGWGLPMATGAALAVPERKVVALEGDGSVLPDGLLSRIAAVTSNRFSCLLLLFIVAGCVQAQRDSAAYGSRHTHRFQQPPEKAARCFAHNAQEHSGALVSEVRAAGEGRAEVIVRVRNGVTYATADIRRACTGSTGTIIVNVRSSGRATDLLHALVEGC